MPSDSNETPRLNIYDQWVLDTFGVDPSTYAVRNYPEGVTPSRPPEAAPSPPAFNAAPASPAPPVSPTAPDADLPARKALTGKMVASDKKASPSDLAVVAEHLTATMPLSELKTLDASGMTFLVTQGDVTTALPALSDTQARGYRPKNTYKGRPGVYYALTKQIVIATQTGPGGARVLPGKATSASADVLLHETGHALSRTTFFANLADRDDFEAAYSAPVNGSLAGEYFRQPGHPAQGRDETFVESHAMYLTEPATLKAESPAIFAYWQTRLAH